MRLLPCGTTSVLVELDDRDEVPALYAALVRDRPAGVVEIVPAARTVLLVTDPGVTSLTAVSDAVRQMTLRPELVGAGELVQIPVTYDGADLDEAARALGIATSDLVRRHTEQEWTVAFCGFAPGFGYLTSSGWVGEVPRRPSPRTRVPAGSVALAGEFTGVYPRDSPGGWQLIGRTEVSVFDPSRSPAALLRPGDRVRFVNVGAA